MLCWTKKDVPLHECILATQSFNPSNCKDHLRNRHTCEETPGLYSDVSTITNSFSSEPICEYNFELDKTGSKTKITNSLEIDFIILEFKFIKQNNYYAISYFL